MYILEMNIRTKLVKFSYICETNTLQGGLGEQRRHGHRQQRQQRRPQHQLPRPQQQQRRPQQQQPRPQQQQRCPQQQLRGKHQLSGGHRGSHHRLDQPAILINMTSFPVWVIKKTRVCCYYVYPADKKNLWFWLRSRHWFWGDMCRTKRFWLSTWNNWISSRYCKYENITNSTNEF